MQHQTKDSNMLNFQFEDPQAENQSHLINTARPIQTAAHHQNFNQMQNQQYTLMSLNSACSILLSQEFAKLTISQQNFNSIINEFNEDMNYISHSSEEEHTLKSVLVSITLALLEKKKLK